MARNNKELDDLLNSISIVFDKGSVRIDVPDNVMAKFSLMEIAGIDKSDLEYEFSAQTKFYAFLAALLGYATDKKNKAATLFKQVESQAAEDVEKRLVEKGERATDKKIEKLMKLEKIYIEAADKDDHWSAVVTTLTKLIASLENRKDMLLQIGSRDKKADRVI